MKVLRLVLPDDKSGCLIRQPLFFLAERVNELPLGEFVSTVISFFGRRLKGVAADVKIR
jgi:hypothetical protein